jgi:tetratricopeptide (TPR) repeat protein
MWNRHAAAAAVVVAGLVLAGGALVAQSPSGGHVHYTQPQQQASPTGALAPRLQNLGTHVFPVSTRNAAAQRFINQGLNLAYAFNHAEARRAFREAARLDPALAMAHWGQALVLGPNINAAMEPNEEPAAYEHVQDALRLSKTATPRERALIEALATRYSGTADDRGPRNAAYADAMRTVHERFPNDLDIATLYVESVMDLRPWGYWQRDGTPHEGTADIVALTERVIARNPRHPGALHLYIHLVEATDTPERAEKAADTLMTLMPAAGHIVHMPAHIYQRVGRYNDAIRSNQLAIAADEGYISQCRAQGLYPTGYYPHNIHFLWFAATFDGQREVAIDAARTLSSKIDDETLKSAPLTAGFRIPIYYALTRFGQWDLMLKEPEPPAFNGVLRAAWHYTRGLALVATGQLPAAESELQKLRALMTDPGMQQPLFSPNLAGAVLAPGPEVLSAEIAAARGQHDVAISHLERAVRLEDGLVYTEPAEFHYPPRHALGAVLLEAGRPAEAETVYWEDLRRHPNNGWALFGLLQALRAQNKGDDAAVVEARFKTAWARSDVTLTGSRFARAGTPARTN